MISIGVFANFVDSVNAQSDEIPSWIKNNAGWWADGQIDDTAFIQGIQFLISEGIISIPQTESGESSGNEIPSWIKNNAGWWADGQIDDTAFIQGIQFLVKENIISTQNEQPTPSTKGDDDYYYDYGTSSNDSEENAPSQPNSSDSKTFKDAITIKPQPKKPITLLVYMVGSDLEKNKDEKKSYAATRDIEQMMEGMTSNEINVVLATGGSSDATVSGERIIDFRTPSMQLVLSGQDKPDEIARLNTKAMSSPEILSDFIETTVETFPAEKYVLIMWNHGYGFNGYGKDTMFPIGKDNKGNIVYDQMSLLQLQQALESKNIPKFELIGFDACQMSTYEVAEKLEKYSKYLVASQEDEPAIGWDYIAIVKSLNGKLLNSNNLGEDLGAEIINSYITSIQNIKSETNSKDPTFSLLGTLSLLDLQNFNNLKLSYDKFKKYVINLDKTDLSDFSRSLKDGDRFGLSKVKPHVDFSHFIGKFGSHYEGKSNKIGTTWTKTDTNSVITNIKSVTLISENGKGHKNAKGLSIFLPKDKSSLENTYSEIGGKGGYSDYKNTEKNELVDFYLDYLQRDVIKPTFDIKLNGNVFSGNYYSSDVDEINFYFTADTDNDNWIEIFYTDEFDVTEEGFNDGIIDFTWDGYESALCNNDYCYPVSPYWDWGDRDFAFIPVILLYDVNDSDGIHGNLIYDITDAWDDADYAIFVGFSPEGDHPGDVTKQLWSLEEGDVIQIRARDVTKDFKQTKFTAVEKMIVDKDFGFSWEIFDWGPLDVFVEVCDFSANCADIKGPFSINPVDVPGIDWSEVYEWDQNDPLNPSYFYTDTDSQYGCPEEYPYLHSDGYCEDYQEDPSDNDTSNYGCPEEYPFLHSDGSCEDYSEDPSENYASNTDCPVDKPYYHSDGTCEDYSETETNTETNTPVNNYDELLDNAWELYDLNRFEDSEDAFRELTQDYPNDSESWEGLGWSLLETASNNFDEVQSSFETSYNLDNDNMYAVAGIGWVYLELENCQMAEDTFDFALSNDSDNEDALEGLSEMSDYGC